MLLRYLFLLLFLNFKNFPGLPYCCALIQPRASSHEVQRRASVMATHCSYAAAATTFHVISRAEIFKGRKKFLYTYSSSSLFVRQGKF